MPAGYRVFKIFCKTAQNYLKTGAPGMDHFKKALHFIKQIVKKALPLQAAFDITAVGFKRYLSFLTANRETHRFYGCFPATAGRLGCRQNPDMAASCRVSCRAV